MIRIGLNDQEKRDTISRYLSAHGNVTKVFIFYPKAFPLAVEVTEHIEYADIIMYKFFYRLLEMIDDNTLLVFNECLRTQNRSDLTYNCAHHYANQTSHVIIFEHFPFIQDANDFMILLDLQRPDKYKGKSFGYQILRDEDVQAVPQRLTLRTIDAHLTADVIQKYEKKKEQLFNGLGNSDPDTIPRQLHIWAGNLKKSLIEPDRQYVARNDRFKLPNVVTYRGDIQAQDYIMVDFPHRRIDFNDFLKKTGMRDIHFINSGLKVDLYYINEFRQWTERLGEFYAEASLCK